MLTFPASLPRINPQTYTIQLLAMPLLTKFAGANVVPRAVATRTLRRFTIEMQLTHLQLNTLSNFFRFDAKNSEIPFIMNLFVDEDTEEAVVVRFNGPVQIDLEQPDSQAVAFELLEVLNP